jgi:Fic family protein
MLSQIIAQYTHPAQFEPLLPSESKLGPLLERAATLLIQATQLSTGAPGAQRELKLLLRKMNSYYTNRMEGVSTRPAQIDRALANHYSDNAELRRRQRLAVAHIRTEEACEGLEEAQDLGWLYSATGLCNLHDQLFGGLEEQDLKLADGTPLIPGALRTTQVAVGKHEPPLWSSVPTFLERWGSFYTGLRKGELSIVGVAASHHRLAWVHPFADGNGRVARLQTHLVLRAMGLTGGGLWSPLRGFARTEERYKALLQAADEHRRGDYDGRGNLSESALVEWIEYVLDVCIDQVAFMADKLNVQGMGERIRAALTYENTVDKNIRTEAALPLHYLFMGQGELSRQDFKNMTGLGDRVAISAVSALVKSGFVATSSAYGPLRFAIPPQALRFYFPALWPEAEQDAAQPPQDN